MRNLTSTLGRLAVVLASALALGSCSRAEYAFLPKSASYLGTTTAAPKARVTPVASPATAPAPKAATTLVAQVAETPAAAPVTAKATAKAPAAPAKRLAVAVQVPALAEPSAVAPAPATTPEGATAPAPKLSLLQRLALNKAMHKLDKQLQKATARQGDNTASTARGGLDSKLRYAIIFGAISLIFFVIGGSVGNLIGAILLIIGLLFLLFWLLDNL